MSWVTELLNIAIQCPCGEQHDVEENCSHCRVAYDFMLLAYFPVTSTCTFFSLFVIFYFVSIKYHIASWAHFV